MLLRFKLAPIYHSEIASKLPFFTEQLQARFVNHNLFSVAGASGAMAASRPPSFGIDAGHEIRSQAQPDYSVAPWTSRADFHTPPQSFLTQHYLAPPRTARTEVWSQFQRPHCPYAPGPATVDTPSVATARPASRKRGSVSLFDALAPSKSLRDRTKHALLSVARASIKHLGMVSKQEPCI